MMAGNPLFSCIKSGKKFTYDLNADKRSPEIGHYRPLYSSNVANVHQAKIMQGPNRPDRGGQGRKDSPQVKRRKTDFDDDDWGDDDDDIAFTQENIAALDAMTTEAMTHQNPSYQSRTDPGPSCTPLVQQTPRQLQSAPGALNNKTSTPAVGGAFRPPSSHISNISLIKRNDSSSSKSSGSTKYPSSALSGRQTTSITSTESSKSTAGSAELPFAPSKKPAQGSSSSTDSSNDSSGFNKSLVADRMREELEQYKKQCSDLKAEVSSLEHIKQEIYVKEGENKILREQLTSAKQEKLKLTEQQIREQSQREKNLQAEVQRLTTELLFKDRDLTEMRDKNTRLESQLASLDPESRDLAPSAVQSPRIKRVLVEEKSPKGKRGFPTKRTFLAEEGTSPAVSTQAAPVESNGKPAKKNLGRRWSLNTNPCKGVISGGSMLAKLTEKKHSPSSGVTVNSLGLMELVQMNDKVMDLQSFHFERDCSRLLSPVPTRRLSEKKSTVERVKAKPLVSLFSYSRALEGLHEITTSTFTCLAPVLREPPTTTEQSVTDGRSTVLFLPLLNDYLSHYIDMMNCYVERGQTVLTSQSSCSSSSRSSSFNSSLESLTGSLSILLKDGAKYANNLECQALCALHVLYKLVLYSGTLRDVLLCPDNLTSDSSSSSFEKVGEEMEIDVTSSPDSSLESRGNESHLKQIVQDCHLLNKILRLANPGKTILHGDDQQVLKFSEQIVEKALSILTVLCQHSSEQQIECILPVISKGVLTNCITCSRAPGVVLHGVEMMSSLIKHNKAISSLCVCSGGCVLSSLYGACSSHIRTFSADLVVAFAAKFVDCVCDMISCHKGGIVLLLDTDCRCSIQIQKAVILTLHQVLLQHQDKETRETLSVLRKGTLLLHTLCQRDLQFEEHHYTVQHQYVQLICGLAIIYKECKGNFEIERSAVSDLWDFGRDDSGFSQDSDDSMETS